jgi:hypothetical protein
VEKILDPTGTKTPDPSVVQPVANRYTGLRYLGSCDFMQVLSVNTAAADGTFRTFFRDGTGIFCNFCTL